MDFLILGGGSEELGWARAIAGRTEHRLRAAYPGFEALPDVPRPVDLDDALATAGVEAVVVGGPIKDRPEALRRVAAAGLPAICLHPPGDDSEAYYQVALSREETGAILVPDLPARLHPGVDLLRRALEGQELGAFRGIRHESPVRPDDGDGDLARHAFSRVVDVVRALLGEVEAVNATGDPPGEHPTEGLVVQLRGPEARRAEVRLWTGPSEPKRLVVAGSEGSLTLEYDREFATAARLVRRARRAVETVSALGDWDPHAAILATLTEAIAGRDTHPNLIDGTRATELAEATIRSLRRGRTVDLHYEEISEDGTFKSVMTSFGCIILLCILVALPAALVGPALGLPWTIYIAYAIPPILIGFILLQLLRFAIRRSKDVQRRDEGQPRN